ncbi:hypothetical protein BC830DRAFT_1159020 [Chytriomyces sp. MP71]|nr:hypothetical protein BC830DRAFT_1159020 [Chytriomyces sp. MP71]
MSNVKKFLVTITIAIVLYYILALTWENEPPRTAYNFETPNLASSQGPTVVLPFQSPLQDWTQPYKDPRILYINTHPGTQANFAHILARLGLRFASYDPSAFGFAMSQQKAQELIDSGLARKLCDSADVVVISDTCAHGRFILQTLSDPNPNNHCSSKIVLELTNRFDWGYNDPQEREEFRAFMWGIATQHSDKVFFTSNNPLESRHFSDFTIATPPFRLLRPIGASNVPATFVNEHDSKLAIIRTKEGSPILTYLDRMGVKYKHVVQGAHAPYGGPRTAARHRAFIEFPYQASTMKLYENAAAGVVMLVPSPKFYFELQKAGFFSTPNIQTSLLYQGKAWEKYHDYYSKDMKPYLHYFDSFEELADMLKNPVDAHIKQTVGSDFSHIVNQTICGWADVFIEMGYHQMMLDRLPYSYGQGPKPDKVKLRQGVQEVLRLEDWKESYEKSKELMEAAERVEWEEIEVRVKLPA